MQCWGVYHVGRGRLLGCITSRYGGGGAFGVGSFWGGGGGGAIGMCSI